MQRELELHSSGEPRASQRCWQEVPAHSQDESAAQVSSVPREEQATVHWRVWALSWQSVRPLQSAVNTHLVWHV